MTAGYTLPILKMALAISQYDEILSFATETAMIAHQHNSFPRDFPHDKRNQIIEMLRRSREQEELALSYIQRAMEAVQE